MASIFDQLANQITGVKLETAYLPEVSIAHPFEPGPPSPYLAALKPKITLELAGGAIRPIVIAPYGDPGAPAGVNMSALRAGALALTGFGLGLLLLGKLERRRRR